MQPDLSGSFYSVKRSCKSDIHKDKIGNRGLFECLERHLPGVNRVNDPVSCLFQDLGQVEGDQAFVFHNLDSFPGHVKSPVFLIWKINSVPLSVRTSIFARSW